MEVNNKVHPPVFHRLIPKRTHIFGRTVFDNILSYISLILFWTDTSSYFRAKGFIVLFHIRTVEILE